MRQASIALLFLAVVAACSSRDASERVRLPSREGSGSVILRLNRNAKLSALFALEADDTLELPLDPPLTGTDFAELEVALLPGDLASHRLKAGMLAPDPSGDLLPLEHGRFFRGTLNLGAELEWIESQGATGTLAAFRISNRKTCVDYRVQSFMISSIRDPQYLLPLGEGVTLLSVGEGHLYEARGYELHELSSIPPGLPDEAVAIEHATGAVFFAGRQGKVWRGTIEASPAVSIQAEPFSRVPESASVIRLKARAQSDGTFELFALTYYGGFWRFDGANWTELYRFSPNGRVAVEAELLDGEASEMIALMNAFGGLVRYRDGEVRLDRPASQIPPLFSGLSKPDGGLIVADGEGFFRSVDSSGRWTDLGQSTIGLSVYEIVRFGQGFFFTGAGGFVGSWSPDDGFCPAVQVSIGALRTVAPHGRGFIIASDRVAESRSDVVISILEPLPR